MDLRLESSLTRRHLLQTVGLTLGAAALAACTPRRGAVGSAIATASASPSPASTPTGTLRVTSPSPTPDAAATKLVGDVVDFQLRGPFAWNGGSVTMKLHEAFVGGDRAYFVRTDASDQAFAQSEQLVFVPLLAAAGANGKVARIYLFEGGADGQLPILSTAPGMRDFTSLYRIHRVRFTGDPEVLDSPEKVEAAERAGRASIEATEVVVNYPVVKWPGGELPVDTVVEKPLEGGPLLAKPDTEKMLVTFKLHQCFPESRYIVTDTSAVPMAPMMNIEGAPMTEGLAEAGAASTITVFGNGIPGPGAMGFQPGIFREKAGEPSWSPIWDHFTALWKDPSKAVLLRSQAELDARVKAGEIELFRGTPDTNGVGFVVNCPSPIVAPNDFAVTAG